MKIAFIASRSDVAQAALTALKATCDYGNANDAKEAEVMAVAPWGRRVMLGRQAA